MTGQSLVSYGLLDPLVPSPPTHPAQERPLMRGTEVEGLECTRDLQAPGRGLAEGIGADLTSAAPGGSSAPRAGS